MPITERRLGQEAIVIAEVRLYETADGRIVEKGDPDAAYLFSVEGAPLRGNAEVARYQAYMTERAQAVEGSKEPEASPNGARKTEGDTSGTARRRKRRSGPNVRGGR